MTRNISFYTRRKVGQGYKEVVICDTIDELFESINKDFCGMEYAVKTVCLFGYDCEIAIDREKRGFIITYAEGEYRGQEVYRLKADVGEAEVGEAEDDEC